MSQVTFKTTITVEGKAKRVEVMAGWDRPLHHYFMTVFDLDAGDDDPETVWDSINSPSVADSQGTARIRAKLYGLGIDPPEGFWELVHRQEGNVLHAYEDGAWAQH
jgi:hypothetical protein